MYPIVLIVGVALFQKNARIALTTAVFAAVGGCISLYHYGIQKLSFLSDSAPVMRKCVLHWPICQLSRIHHHSFYGTGRIFTDLNHKPFHVEMAKGVELN